MLVKRQFFSILLLTLAFAMSGCGRNAGVIGPGRPVSAYIGEYVSKIEIAHSAGGTESKWTAAGAEVDSLRSWANGLKYDILDVEEGQTPGDRDGGEVYSFALTEGEYPGFSYVIDSSDSYLLIEGHWYTVSNPSRPPCAEQDEIGAAEPYSVQGTVFTYNGVEYDLTEQSAAVNAIMDVRQAGDYLVIDGHVGPQNGVYCIFDTKTESFVKTIAGANLVWRGDDLSTAVYCFWSDVLDYDGNVLMQCDLADGEYIYDLSFSEDGQAILITIVSNDGAERTETYKLV